MQNLFLIPTMANREKAVYEHIIYKKIRVMDHSLTQSIFAIAFATKNSNKLYIESNQSKQVKKIIKSIRAVNHDETQFIHSNEISELLEIEGYYEVSTGLTEKETVELVGEVNLKSVITHLLSIGQDVVNLAIYDSEDDENVIYISFFSPNSQFLINFDYYFDFSDYSDEEIDGELKNGSEDEIEEDSEEESEGESDDNLKKNFKDYIEDENQQPEDVDDVEKMPEDDLEVESITEVEEETKKEDVDRIKKSIATEKIKMQKQEMMELQSKYEKSQIQLRLLSDQISSLTVQLEHSNQRCKLSEKKRKKAERDLEVLKNALKAFKTILV
ncbi:MAG: hypothetical protein ACTSVU_01955 [Promethearchaeota archaeon]